MEPLRVVPALSPAEAEDFFATGSDAQSAAPGPEPGTSQHTHAAGHCPHCGPACRGGAAHHARVEDGVFWREADPVGIDVPGVGVVGHPANVFKGSPVRSGRTSVAAGVSQSLWGLGNGDEGSDGSDPSEASKAERRDGLLAQLIFAARDLASRGIYVGRDRASCAECHACSASPEHLEHAETCRVWRVQKTLQALVALEFDGRREGGAL